MVLLYDSDKPATAILPVISLALPSISGYAMWLRRFMFDESNMEYIKFAKAKGVPNNAIWFKHMLFTLIQPFLPGQMDPNLINNDPATGMQIINQKPNSTFWFGTNAIGQDLWSRLWAGTCASLYIGLMVAVIQTVVGIGLGVFWGYVRMLDLFFTELY